MFFLQKVNRKFLYLTYIYLLLLSTHMREIKKILIYLKGYAIYYPIAIIFMITLAASQNAFAVIVKYFIDFVNTGIASQNDLFIIAKIGTIVALVTFLSKFGQDYTLYFLAENLLVHIQRALDDEFGLHFAHILHHMSFPTFPMPQIQIHDKRLLDAFAGRNDEVKIAFPLGSGFFVGFVGVDSILECGNPFSGWELIGHCHTSVR